MAIKLLHTADIHLGMKFTRGYEADVREELIQAREDVIGNIVQIANERTCDLLIISGDLFHNTKPKAKDINHVARQLRDFTGLVIVLPGNHDYFDSEPDTLWPKFIGVMGENTTVMKDPEVELVKIGDQIVALYPGPCHSSHSSENAIGWVKDARAGVEADFHIGVAHGNLQGVTPDFNQDYFPMTPEELQESGIPLWLLGHAHIRFPDVDNGTGELALFASTPEPDGFDCRHDGSAWLVTLDDSGTNSFESIQIGQYQFHEIRKQLSGDKDLDKLADDFTRFDASKDLVKLKLEGRLSSTAYDTVALVLQDLQDKVLYLEDDCTGLLRQIAQADIDKEFTQESFPHRLLSALAKDDDNALALQIAYELINEVRS